MLMCVVISNLTTYSEAKWPVGKIPQNVCHASDKPIYSYNFVYIRSNTVNWFCNLLVHILLVFVNLVIISFVTMVGSLGQSTNVKVIIQFTFIFDHFLIFFLNFPFSHLLILQANEYILLKLHNVNQSAFSYILYSYCVVFYFKCCLLYNTVGLKVDTKYIFH